MLLKTLIEENKKISNLNEYYFNKGWSKKAKTTIAELNKKGLKNFRGMHSGVSSSFGDNLVSDARNEYSGILKKFLKLFSLPFIKNIFNAQLKLTERYIYNYLKHLNFIYTKDKNVLDLIEKYNFLDSVNFGCNYKIDYKDKSYSVLYLEIANRIEKLNKHFEFSKLNSYMEIGGGFGANVHFLINNFPNIKKFIYLDAVPNLYVGTEYLKYYFRDNVKDYLTIKDYDEIKFSTSDDLEIICIPPWKINKINANIDHFHNAYSFVEMQKEVVKNYFKALKKIKIKQISIISGLNTDSTVTTIDEVNRIFGNELYYSLENPLVEKLQNKECYLISI